MRTIDKVNYYLAKRGKTGADLSRALGLSNSIYSQWNTGKSKPSKNKLPAIADFLNVSVNDLLPDNERPPIPGDGAKKAPDLRIGGEFGELSAEERELVLTWRALNQGDRARQLDYLLFLAKGEKDK